MTSAEIRARISSNPGSDAVFGCAAQCLTPQQADPIADRVRPDPPSDASDTARRAAERLAPTKAGVVAFSTSGDAELGDYDEEPTIIFKAGRLPAPFEEA